MSEAEQWAGAMGAQWAANAAAMERQLAPAGAVAIEALAPQPGERILDLGCGSGATTRAIATEVEPDGEAFGVDVSPDQIAVAEASAAADSVANIAFLAADAATHAFPPQRFDGLFSRFGSMFFDAPEAAFGNLLRALKPGARVAMVAWRPMDRNPLFSTPNAVADATLGPAEPKPPGAPGPFAWAERAAFEPLLSAAGFDAVRSTARRIEMSVGLDGEGSPAARAARILMRIGPAGRRAREASEAGRAALATELATALAPYVDGASVRIPGEIWLIEARRP